MSATPDSTLANPKQRIADLERQLAECKAERDEALQRETATAEVLQVINSSRGDLAPVFDAILEKAHTLCGAVLGSLAVSEGEYFRVVAMRDIPEGFAKVGTHLVQRLLDGEPFVHIPDIMAMESPSDGPLLRAARAAGRARTALAVPLRKDGALLGYITANRQEVRPFSNEQIALLQNFAAQAVIAMENARLLTETREALERQTATAEILRVISSSPTDVQPTFDVIADAARSSASATSRSIC